MQWEKSDEGIGCCEILQLALLGYILLVLD